MCQKLHVTEINLATEKQAVLDLKAQLQQAKEAARVAREAVEAAVKASYERGVLDIETRLTEEVAMICKDYCTESQGVAMDQAGVPTDSELRKAENIFFPEDIREIPESNLPSEKLLPAQAALPDTDVPRGERVDKEAQPPTKDKPSEDSLTIRDVVSQAKDAESKSKAEGAHSEAANPKKDPLKDKAQNSRCRIFFCYSVFVFHFCGFCHCL